ncbi:protein yippee-like [Phragmites australis]|uniref:protein yippee-like n=1 Tax=Phragmites australis TaxID=29695 RepID=UPI002D765D03|nr:protein yippee-like [Phragmites australis]
MEESKRSTALIDKWVYPAITSVYSEVLRNSVAPALPIRGAPADGGRHGHADPAPPAVSVDGGAASATPEESAAVAADAVAEIAKRLTVDTDDANTGPIKLDDAGGNVYSCKHCHAHLGLAADIVSKAFHCKNGKAYLFNKVINVTVGVKEDRMMITGMHTISDISCVGCGCTVGWKYEVAHEKSQKYKEGKYILERYMLSGPDGSHYSVTNDAHVAGSDADDV